MPELSPWQLTLINYILEKYLVLKHQFLTGVIFGIILYEMTP